MRHLILDENQTLALCCADLIMFLRAATPGEMSEHHRAACTDPYHALHLGHIQREFVSEHAEGHFRCISMHGSGSAMTTPESKLDTESSYCVHTS